MNLYYVVFYMVGAEMPRILCAFDDEDAASKEAANLFWALRNERTDVQLAVVEAPVGISARELFLRTRETENQTHVYSTIPVQREEAWFDDEWFK